MLAPNACGASDRRRIGTGPANAASGGTGTGGTGVGGAGGNQRTDGGDDSGTASTGGQSTGTTGGTDGAGGATTSTDSGVGVGDGAMRVQEGGWGADACARVVDGAPIIDAAAIQCWSGPGPSSFPDFGNGCTGNQDCVLAVHKTDCCNSMSIVAVNWSKKGAFDAAEAICRSQYPAIGCACPAQPTTLDDGTTTTFLLNAVAECASGECRSRFNGSTFACGERTCTALQLCTETFPSIDAGSAHPFLWRRGNRVRRRLRDMRVSRLRVRRIAGARHPPVRSMKGIPASGVGSPPAAACGVP